MGFLFRSFIQSYFKKAKVNYLTWSRQYVRSLSQYFIDFTISNLSKKIYQYFSIELELITKKLTTMLQIPNRIPEVEKPAQFDSPQFPEISPALEEVDDLVQASKARSTFKVTGKDLTVAVLDTGLRSTHVDFKDRVITQKNYTTDYHGDENNANDGQGHGTNVTGIIAANGIHKGIAPEAGIIPIKVLTNSGGGNFKSVSDALDWIINNHDEHNISVICMSLGDSGNYRNEEELFDASNIRQKIKQLRDINIATVIASGNDFFTHNSLQGMSYPAIIRECISVGAVYDSNEGGFNYQSGASAFSSDRDRITPFSQRLHPSLGVTNFTTIFAPGAPVTSSGINNDNGESIQHGTSQAAPVTAGAILLIQELYKRTTGNLPSIEEVINFLRRGGIKIFDGDDEHDNVTHTNLEYARLDIFDSLSNLVKGIRYQMFVQQMIQPQIKAATRPINKEKQADQS